MAVCIVVEISAFKRQIDLKLVSNTGMEIEKNYL
jgi:hypothetical protein